MKLSYICVLIAGILPYIFVAYAKFSIKGYNNNAPREFSAKLEGRQKRAYFAHLNSFESFPFYAVGVIIANITGVDLNAINLLSLSYLVFRVLYGLMYIYDMATLRSVFFGLAFLCITALFILSLA